MKWTSLLLFAWLALSSGGSNASGIEEQARLAQLVQDASSWKDQGDSKRLSTLHEAESLITECPAGSDPPRDGNAVIYIKNVEYAFTTISTGESTRCFFLNRPFRKPLSVAEASALQTAILFPEAISAPRKNATTPLKGEQLFVELREAARSGEKPLISPDDASLPGHGYQLRSCGPRDYSDIESAGRNTEFIYNAMYSWSEVSDQSSTCIYLHAPISRGLNKEEAEDFVLAMASRMGTSPNWARSRGLDSTSADVPHDRENRGHSRLS